MTATTIIVRATIVTPDGVPTRDYIRAVGNYLVDMLPMAEEGTTNRCWKAGREVWIDSQVEIESDGL